MILGKDEIIVIGLVKMSSSSLLLELLAAPDVQAALPSAGGKLGAWQVRCLGLPVEDKKQALSSAREVFLSLAGEKLSGRR